MAKVIFGNHSAVIVPRRDRDRIRKFYRDVLGCKIIRRNKKWRYETDFHTGVKIRRATLRMDIGSFPCTIAL